MRQLILLILIWFFHPAAFSQAAGEKKVAVLNFGQFEPLLNQKNDTVYLVNFWATWCAPCVAELPTIKAIEEKYQNKKFKVLLVSLDIPGQLNTRLIPFLLSRKITSKVVLLDDPQQNVWIDKVDPGWSGEIPFTVIYGKNFRETHSKAFDFKTLDLIVKQKLNLP
jgi:thiol-disulfide isomerase/thioredoxin